MLKLSDRLKTLAKSAAVVGLIGTLGTALSSAPVAAEMHGGGGGFHGGGFGGFHGGGFRGDGLRGEGGFHGDRDFRGDGDFRHVGGWRRGQWYGPGWTGWYGVGVGLEGYPYGCSYYDYYYGYCDN